MKLFIPVIFSQKDSRWANTLLGFNTQSVYNFANYACLISCLAMVARYYGNDVNPLTINDKLKAIGAGKGFAAGSGNYVFGALTKLFPKIIEKVTATPAKLTDAQIGEIKTALDAGFPVMIHLDYNPQTVANDQHWVLVIGYNPDDENDMTIADPIDGTEKSLKKYLGWFKPSARDTIERYVIYEGDVPVKTVEVPANIYPNIIHGSTEWDKTSKEYTPERDPADTLFEDVQRVVSGYKSRATTLENERDQARIDLEKANTEIRNRVDQLANEREACQRTTTALNADISTKEKMIKTLTDAEGKHGAVVKELEGKLREAQAAIGKRDSQITELATKLDQCKKGVPVESIWAKLVKWFNTWKN